MRNNNVLLLLIPWWEHKHHGGQVGGGGKVESRIAGTAFQFIFVDHTAAFIPFVHGHPAHGLFHPLVQAQLPEHILIGWRLLGLAECVPYLVDGDRLIEGGIGLVPVLFICPVCIIRQAEDHRVEPGIVFPAFKDIERFLVNFPADAVPIRSGGCQEKPQRLLPGIATALGHHIIQGAVWLRVKFVEDAGADIQTVLCSHFRREHLVDASGRLINHPLRGWDDLDPLAKRRGLLHHIHGNLKNDSRLLTV